MVEYLVCTHFMGATHYVGDATHLVGCIMVAGSCRYAHCYHSVNPLLLSLSYNFYTPEALKNILLSMFHI